MTRTPHLGVARFVVAFLIVILAAPSSRSQEVGGMHSVAAPFKEPVREGQPFEPTMDRYPGIIPIEIGALAKSAESKSGEETQIEHPQSIDGTQYTVLTPLYFGGGNNYSFFRFPNTTLSTATFYATLIGSPTGHNYGTVIVTVPSYASPQYGISDVFSTLGITGPNAGDTNLSLYLQSPQAGQGVGFQHVVWNSVTGFFENASICTYRADIDYSILNRALVNIHTLKIPSYPGIIFLHNYASFPVSYQVDVYNARNGVYIGSVYFNLGANDIGSEYFSDTEKTLGWTPGDNDYHVNMAFTALGTANYYGLAAQAINNLQLDSLTNMSVACGVNP